MTEQPPRSTLEKVRHQYSLVEVSTTAGDQAIAAIETTCRKAILEMLEYIPEGSELDQGLVRYREAFLWFTHAVQVNPSDNSTKDGKLVQDD